MSPPMQRSAAALMTPSGAPPIPTSMSIPVSGRQVLMAAETSPSVMSRILAPASRISRMSRSWRGRSRITTVRSSTYLPSASATARRFSRTGRVRSTTPRASGPTAIFSM